MLYAESANQIRERRDKETKGFGSEVKEGKMCMNDWQIKDFTHDAPSLVWKIYDLMEADEVGKAEALIYKVFEAIRKEKEE